MKNSDKPVIKPFGSFKTIKEETPYYLLPSPPPMSSNELRIFLNDWIPYID